MTPILLCASASLRLTSSSSLPRDANLPRQQRFPHVIRMGQVQYGVTQKHQQLFVIASEYSSQRLLASLDHDSFANPLPELRLCGPKLFPIATNDKCRLFLSPLLLGNLFLFVHLNTPLALHAFLDKADRK